jgi:soluble lytic murein transglycosylase-like protein
MITLALLRGPRALKANILMRFCFILLWIAAQALFAGDTPARPQRITSVVRTDARTGKLVRSIVVTPRPATGRVAAGTVNAPRVVAPAVPKSQPAAPKAIDEAVDQIAARQSLAPELIHSVIKVESNYNPFAVSSKGALGLMQLIPATARRFGVSDVFDPVENIEGGAKYLRYLLDLYNGNYALALAAYNAGENAVAKYGTVPPYRETQNYVLSVAAQLQKAKAESARQKEKKVIPEEPAPDGARHIQQILEPDGTVRYVTR